MPTKLEITLAAFVLLLVASIIFFEIDQLYNDPFDPFFFKVESADYQVSCTRAKPTNLFLNFYGNSKKGWLSISLGKDDKNIAMLIVFRDSKSSTVKTLPLVSTDSGWKPLWTLNEEEKGIYEEKMNLSAEELKFLNRCMAPKIAI